MDHCATPGIVVYSSFLNEKLIKTPPLRNPMKTIGLFGLATLTAGALLGADSTAKDDVSKAAKALADKSYSWKTTVVVPEGTQFRPGPTEGKTEKDGPTWVSITFGDNTTQAVIHGEKAAITDRDGAWQSVSESENAEGPARFRGAMVRNLAKPAVQAAELAGQTKDLKKEGDVYSGELTEEGAKTLMRFRGGRGGGGGGPNILIAKGSVKFWVKDGLLQKYEHKVDGSMDFNGNEVEIKRTTTVEIKDVGTTKVAIPEGAKSKLN